MNKQDFQKGFQEAYKKGKQRLTDEFKLDTSLTPKKQADSLVEEEARFMSEEMTAFFFDSIALIAITKAKEILGGSDD